MRTSMPSWAPWVLLASPHRLRLILAGLIAVSFPEGVVAQRGRETAPPSSGWANQYEPRVNYEGITRADRAFAMARLAEIEQILYRIPELASPTEFVVRKQYWGGGRPIIMKNGTSGYSLRLWFFARYGPAREVGGEGCVCLSVTINSGPESRLSDEHGRPIIIEGDAGEPIPGATVTYRGAPSDEREVSASVIFTRGGEFPWEPVSRETYLRALIHEVEGLKGEKVADFRKALEKTAYERWMEEAPQRKKDRADLAARLKGIQTPEEIAKQIAAMEATEREVTEQLKAQDAEDRKRNQEYLAGSTYGDQVRAQIEAMSPEERRRPAMAAKDGELLPLDAPDGQRVLSPKLDFWRVRRSPVEIHSITVSIGGSTGVDQSRDAVIHGLQQAYRNLDWAALKRMVDGPQP
jgi:hypothetical protein